MSRFQERTWAAAFILSVWLKFNEKNRMLAKKANNKALITNKTVNIQIFSEDRLFRGKIS